MDTISKFAGITALLLLIPIATILAQCNNQCNNEEDLLQDGQKALQFQITDNFNLSSFTGSTISYKIQRSPYKAYRLGFGINTSFENGTAPSNSGEQDITEYGLNFNTSFTLMNYLNPDADLKFYYGFGPGVEFGYSEDETKKELVVDTIERTNLRLSALGYTGVEWFFQKFMSIHAEYRVSFRYRWVNESITTENKTINTESTNGFNNNNYSFGSRGVRLGVSLYF